MTLTAQQLETRRRYIGASEASAVLGMSPWQTPADVYWSKVTDAEPVEPNEAMKRGVRLEPVIVDWCAAELGVKVQTNCGTVVMDDAPLCASPDGLIVGKDEAIEAKTSSQPDEWGDEGGDEIPRPYLVQCHHQMHVLKLQRVWVPVLIFAGFRAQWRLYCVQRNEALANAIAEKETAWWNPHVVPRVPPSDEPPDVELLKRLRREPRSRVTLGENGVEAWEEYEQAKALAKKAKELADFKKAQVLTLFGIEEPAEAASLPDGRELTYMSQRSAPRVNTKRLKAEHPDLYEQIVEQGSHRVLRIRKAK